MLQDRLEYSSENCSIGRTLAIIGEKWTMVILRDAFYGVRRFEDFLVATGCPRNSLSTRLATLVEHELLALQTYRESGERTRSEYRLTNKGLDLFPVVVMLMRWGDRWVADETGPAVELRHTGCGGAISAALTCSRGHGGLTARDTSVQPGPGAILVRASRPRSDDRE